MDSNNYNDIKDVDQFTSHEDNSQGNLRHFGKYRWFTLGIGVRSLDGDSYVVDTLIVVT